MCHQISGLSCVDYLDVKSYLSTEEVRTPEGSALMLKTVKAQQVCSLEFCHWFKEQCHLAHLFWITLS